MRNEAVTLSPATDLTEHTMTQDLRCPARTFRAAPAHLVRTPLAARAGMALLSLVMSGTLIGGMLGLFEMRAQDAAIARAAVKGDAAAAEIAVRASREAPRS